MDGVHDMGGMDGFGKVEPESNEPVFHHRWEGRVLAMSRAIGVYRAWTIDTSRCRRIARAECLFDQLLLRKMVSA
jgi:nitrile hydratase